MMYDAYNLYTDRTYKTSFHDPPSPGTSLGLASAAAKGAGRFCGDLRGVISPLPNPTTANYRR